MVNGIVAKTRPTNLGYGFEHEDNHCMHTMPKVRSVPNMPLSDTSTGC